MATSKETHPSLHEPDERIEESAEEWKHAPSRASTAADPESVNARIERDRRVEENAPGDPIAGEPTPLQEGSDGSAEMQIFGRHP